MADNSGGISAPPPGPPAGTEMEEGDGGGGGGDNQRSGGGGAVGGGEPGAPASRQKQGAASGEPGSPWKAGSGGDSSDRGSRESFHSSKPSPYPRITGPGFPSGTAAGGASSGPAFHRGYLPPGQAWWGVGTDHPSMRPGLTHQSVGLTLTNDPTIEDTWDLSDSLADLFQQVNHARRKNASHGQGAGDAAGTPTAAQPHHPRVGEDAWKNVDVDRWISDDTSHGFIRVSSSEGVENSRLFPCTLSTTAQKICLQLGIPHNSLHVQLNGDIIRRMEPFDCPLAVQNEYLASVGYTHVRRIQEEGPKEDLAFLVKFYSGKPVSDSTYSRNQLSSWVYVRKGKLLHQWVRRLCVISGTRLLIYRDKAAKPTVVQLAKGGVEEVQIKGQEHVLKLTSTLQGERSLFVSFTSQADYGKWLRKTKKATSKLPTKADLSGCHLEFLPETVFINDDLQILVLRHNVLRERPIEEDIYTIGWLDDLPRFQALRSLNLADNDLRVFPLALCLLRTLVELNLATNKLEDVPPQVAELANLQVLHLHNNQLSALPEEISSMKQLAVLVLAFNNFTAIPSVLLQSHHANFMVDSIIMAGNRVSRLPTDLLMYMGHIKKVDLRMNRLQLLPTETAKFHTLEHVTHIDIRENTVVDLDIRAVRCLEYLNCDRNGMKSLQVNGTFLKNLFASHNKLETLSVNPKPEWLISMEISHNKLTSLPGWVGDCYFMVRLDVSHNCLDHLSEKLFTDARKLRVLKANHNQLTWLPQVVNNCVLEELNLEHNEIRSLSPQLFLQANRLRCLNLTRNKLCDLPAPHPNDSLNRLQELYLAFNNLGNAAVAKVCCFPRLRVLHLAANKISVIEERDLEKLEQLLELNVSGNMLTYLPSCLGRHPLLQVLRANCNLLQELPCFKNSSALKVLEVSSNHLRNVSMSNLMTSQVNLLDISGNPHLAVSSHDLESVKKSKRLCMVDMRGQNWSLQDLRTVEDPLVTRPWLSGLSQTSGIRNKLSVMVVNKPSLSEQGDALFAVVDGGRNDEVAKALADSLVTTLQAEQAHGHTSSDYMKYTMLTAHRQLKALGQKLGAAAAIVHLSRTRGQSDPPTSRDRRGSKGDSLGRGEWTLRVANVGDTEVVLCHHGRVLPLTRRFDVTDDVEECSRVIKSGGIITEDGRVNGVTFNTRLLGCCYLFPHLIPHPYTTSRPLSHSDRFLILANQGLWKVVSHEEAVKEIRDITDPVVAAKRLQDLAQGYGSRENVAVVVVRLMLSEGERLRVQESISSQRESQRELLRVLSRRSDLLELRDGVPSTPELSDVVIDRSGRAKKSASRTSSGSSSSHLKSTSSDLSGEETNSQGSPKESKNKSRSKESSKRYRKKEEGAHFTLESKLSKRLAEEVKSQELRHAFLAGEENEDEEARNNVIDFSCEVPDNSRTESKWRTRNGPKSWSQAMQDRLAQEVKQMEIHRELAGKDVTSPDHGADDVNGGNWSTVASDRETSWKITPPPKRPPPRPPLPKVPGLVRSDDVSLAQSAQAPVSPPPRPSSATKPKTYLRRPSRPPPPPPPSSPPPLPPPPPAPEPPLLHNVPFVVPSDSLVSLDDFKKEIVRSLHIDRDAILFHQMQMARVQSGSNASLTSIQSDPQYASMREVFSPYLPTSSRSIEVLVHSDQEIPEEEEVLSQRDDSRLDKPQPQKVLLDEVVDLYDDDDDEFDSRHSDSPLMEVDVVDSMEVTVEDLYDQLRNARREVAGDTDSRTNAWNGDAAGEEQAVDSDSDTLVDDSEDTWLLGAEDVYLLPEEDADNGRKKNQRQLFRGDPIPQKQVEDVYATVRKTPKHSDSNLANNHPHDPDLPLMWDPDPPVSRTPDRTLGPATSTPTPPVVPSTHVPPPLPPPPPLPQPPSPSSSTLLSNVPASRLSNQRSIIITYL